MPKTIARLDVLLRFMARAEDRFVTISIGGAEEEGRSREELPVSMHHGTIDFLEPDELYRPDEDLVLLVHSGSNRREEDAMVIAIPQDCRGGAHMTVDSGEVMEMWFAFRGIVVLIEGEMRIHTPFEYVEFTPPQS